MVQNTLTTVVKVIDEASKPLKNISKSLQSVSKSADTVTKAGKQINSGFKEVDKNVKNVNKVIDAFDGRLLSLLFFGQAIGKVFGGALKSIANTYFKIIDSNNVLIKRTNALKAAFTFLKFSIFDAIAQSPLFLKLIDFIIRLTDSIAAFIGENPGLAKFIGIFLAIGAAVGTLLTALGIIGLGLPALINVLATFGTTITGIFAGISLAGVAAFAAIAAVVGLVIAAIVTNFSGARDFLTQAFFTIVTTIKAVMSDLFSFISNILKFIVAIFKGDFEKAAEFGLAAIRALVAGVAKLLIGAGTLVVDALKLLANGLVRALQGLFNSALFSLQAFLNVIIAGINLVIQGFNRISKVKIPTIPKADFSAAAKATAQIADNLQFSFDSANQLEKTFQTIDTLTGNVTAGATENGDQVVNNNNNVVEVNIDASSPDSVDNVKSILEEINSTSSLTTGGSVNTS